MCLYGGGGVSILMDDIIPHIRHYLILQSSQHDSHHTVNGIPLHPPSLSSSFLSSFSFLLSITPPPRVVTAFLQTMLFTSGLSPTVEACYR